MEEEDGHQENGIHATKDSDRQFRLRLCVLNEILNTERDYVRTLLFLQSVRSHPVIALFVGLVAVLCYCRLLDNLLNLSPPWLPSAEVTVTRCSYQY